MQHAEWSRNSVAKIIALSSVLYVLYLYFVIQLLSEPDKQDCWSACPKFDYKTNPGKTECEWEVITKFIHSVILNIMECTWLPRELDVIIFYALQQQQKQFW